MAPTPAKEKPGGPFRSVGVGASFISPSANVRRGFAAPPMRELSGLAFAALVIGRAGCALSDCLRAPVTVASARIASEGFDERVR